MRHVIGHEIVSRFPFKSKKFEVNVFREFKTISDKFLLQEIAKIINKIFISRIQHPRKTRTKMVHKDLSYTK